MRLRARGPVRIMAEERINRKLAAILAADVVGYSRLMAADEAGTLAALKRHRSLAKRAHSLSAGDGLRPRLPRFCSWLSRRGRRGWSHLARTERNQSEIVVQRTFQPATVQARRTWNGLPKASPRGFADLAGLNGLYRLKSESIPVVDGGEGHRRRGVGALSAAPPRYDCHRCGFCSQRAEARVRLPTHPWASSFGGGLSIAPRPAPRHPR